MLKQHLGDLSLHSAAEKSRPEACTDTLLPSTGQRVASHAITKRDSTFSADVH